ncbi:MAG: TolC family protein [Pirellulaceae bacterium]|nr:TolC family protein [Pirellulaceae bacterium]
MAFRRLQTLAAIAILVAWSAWPNFVRGQESQLRAPAEALPPAAQPSPLDHRMEIAIGPARLEELEELATHHHPQMASAWNAIRQAEGRTIQARLYPNPVFGQASPQINGSESQYNLFFSQDILTGGKLRIASAAAAQEIEQAKLLVIRTRFDVITRVRRQFYTTLAGQNRVAVLQDLVAIAGKSNEIGQALLKGGEGTKTDTLLLEIELHKAEVTRQNSETTFEAGKRQLAAAVGLPQLPIETLYGDLAAELPKFELAEVQQGAIALNAQSGIAQLEVARTRLLLNRAIVEPSPTFNVMAGYQYQVAPVGHDQAITQVTMTVPLWDKNQGNIRAADAAIHRAEAEVQRVHVELAAAAAEALGRYRTAGQLVAKYQADIIPKSRQSVELTQRLYEQGQIDFLRLLAAQRTLSEVNLGYIDAQAARWDAAADIANLLQVEEFP